MNIVGILWKLFYWCNNEKQYCWSLCFVFLVRCLRGEEKFKHKCFFTSRSASSVPASLLDASLFHLFEKLGTKHLLSIPSFQRPSCIIRKRFRVACIPQHFNVQGQTILRKASVSYFVQSCWSYLFTLSSYYNADTFLELAPKGIMRVHHLSTPSKEIKDGANNLYHKT